MMIWTRRRFVFVMMAIFMLENFVRVQTAEASFNLASLVKDPRLNSSYYDIIVNHSSNDNSGAIWIGSVAHVLLQKGIGPKWDYISKYKLIYYSPQLLPSGVYEKSTTSNNLNASKSSNSDEETSSIPNEPIFTLNEKNGSIYLHTPANEPILEYLCMTKLYCSCLSCIFSLNIIYTSGSNRISAETVRVFVDDYNDYSPQFYTDDDMLTVNISESSRIGDSFRVVNAVAFDSDAYYNKVTYHLSEHKEGETRSNLFDIAPIEGSANLGKDLLIILKSHLDYEIKREYELYLIASDNGPSGGRTSTIKLQVLVQDENDNSPVCEKSLFMESVKENSIVENFIQIRATDLDSGLNARLMFSILQSFGDENQRFEINKNTGWISLKKELDYEAKTYHELIIRIDDVSTRNNFTTYCSARVNVLDVNDNPAKIKVIKYLNESVQPGYFLLNTMSDAASSTVTSDQTQHDETIYSFSRNQIEIFENNPSQTVLALIRVFDRDSLSNYRFAIQSATNSHEDTTMFEIRSSDRVNREFELIATGPFNSELIQSYRLKIILYDLDSDSELLKDDDSNSDSDSLMLTKRPLINNFEYYRNNFQVILFQHVRILDMNDNKPEFVKKSYQFEINENVANVSLRVPPIEVYDVDTSEYNSHLKFRIGEPTSLSSSSRSNLRPVPVSTIREHLTIEDASAEVNYPVIHVSIAFDYETHGEKIEFDLIAYDVDNRTDACHVTIFVRDVNDNPPMFMNENSTFVLKENSPPNSFIGQVIAIDRDSPGPNSDVSFRIRSEHLRAYFKIYKTGVIANCLPLDREAHPEFTIFVEAFNTNDPSFSQVGVYHVKLEDENDNRPHFVYPKENSTRIILKLPQFETFPNSTNLIRIFDAKAVDDDSGENGRVVYSMEAMNTSPTTSSLPNSFLIDKSNGSVYFNFFTFNITNLEQITRFRGIFRLILGARDSSPAHALSSVPLNLTLYLNYDLKELGIAEPSAAAPSLHSSSVLRSTATVTDLDAEFGTADMISSSEIIDAHRSSESDRTFFQLVSNGVLLIILCTVLMFMLFVACFLFIIFYKKNSGSDKKKKKTKKDPIESATVINKVNYEMSNGKLIRKNPNASSSCLGKMKSGLKFKCSLVKSSSFGNLTAVSTVLSKKNEANLTVKDASLREEPAIIGNSFKVTIKSSDANKTQSKFVFENLNAKLSSDNSLVIEKQQPSPPAIATSASSNNNSPTTMISERGIGGCCSSSSEGSTSSYDGNDQLCIADYSRQILTQSQIYHHPNNSMLFNHQHHQQNQHVGNNVSFTNSNNSTIVINSLSSPTSSSSLSNTPHRGSYNPSYSLAEPLTNTTMTTMATNRATSRPSTITSASASHLATTSNTIKFILSSQLAAAAQRDSNTPRPISVQNNPFVNASSTHPNGVKTEDMLQNLLEKFERFYNNSSLDTNLNMMATNNNSNTTPKMMDRH